MGTKNKPGRFDCYQNAEPDEQKRQGRRFFSPLWNATTFFLVWFFFPFVFSIAFWSCYLCRVASDSCPPREWSIRFPSVIIPAKPQMEHL
jgi:hypothetical protein